MRKLRSATVTPVAQSRARETKQSVIELPRQPLMRELLGEVLHDQRVVLGRTLREVSRDAQVSLGYLSELERGQKEASSELLASIAAALEVNLSDILTATAARMAAHEQVTILPVTRSAA